jgi:hypothetical protein
VTLGLNYTTNALQTDVSSFFSNSWPVLVGLFLLILSAVYVAWRWMPRLLIRLFGGWYTNAPQNYGGSRARRASRKRAAR